MFWVGYDNLFMEPICGPPRSDAWIPRWMAVTYFCTNDNLALNGKKTGLTKGIPFYLDTMEKRLLNPPTLVTNSFAKPWGKTGQVW